MIQIEEVAYKRLKAIEVAASKLAAVTHEVGGLTEGISTDEMDERGQSALLELLKLFPEQP